jgi:signal transduction histidine kinase
LYKAPVSGTPSLSERLTQSLPAPDSQERFDLRSLVDELGMLLAPQARKLGVDLSTRLPPNDVVLVGYRDRLKQAFLNVAVNALEAMPKGGRMWIEMQERPDRVRVANFTTTGGAGTTVAIDLPLVPRPLRH